jgi:AcrR family transcriptional regulator
VRSIGEHTPHQPRKAGLIAISTTKQDLPRGYTPKQGAAGPTKEQIQAASFALFAVRGIRAVGVDELIEACGVAKATFYKHFRSKEQLALAYLDDLYQRHRAALEAAVLARGSGPECLLGVFDALEAMAQTGLPRGASFVHLLIESGRETAVGRASADYLALLHEDLAQMAAAAGVQDPAELSGGLQLIVMGILVSIVEGNLDALRLGRALAAQLIAAELISGTSLLGEVPPPALAGQG